MTSLIHGNIHHLVKLFHLIQVTTFYLINDFINVPIKIKKKKKLYCACHIICSYTNQYFQKTISLKVFANTVS